MKDLFKLIVVKVGFVGRISVIAVRINDYDLLLSNKNMIIK